MTQAQQKENYLRRLKKEYDKAVKENKTIFIFEEQEVLVSYAKYLIQHLENIKQ